MTSRNLTARIVSAALAALVVVGVTVGASGCSAPPASRKATSIESSPEPTPDMGDVTFAAGDDLPPDADIRWGDGLVEDEGWAPVPSEHPGRWSYVNASGTCTAAFRGGVLRDAGDLDDRQATDALIEYQSGADFLGAEWLDDGVFLRHGHEDAGVDHRQFSYTVNDVGYFMAARAFVQADYSVWVIVTCEGELVGPVAREVLSKNLIAVNESPE